MKKTSKQSMFEGMMKLLELQGFKTPMEYFLAGYLTAHGGEKLFLRNILNDLELLKRNPTFWLPHVKDSLKIYMKICDDDIATAKETLIKLFKERNAEIPKWLEVDFQLG